MTFVFVNKHKLEKVVSDLNTEFGEKRFKIVENDNFCFFGLLCGEKPENNSWHLCYIDTVNKVEYAVADVYESLYGEVVLKTTEFCPVGLENILTNRLRTAK